MLTSQLLVLERTSSDELQSVELAESVLLGTLLTAVDVDYSNITWLITYFYLFQIGRYIPMNNLVSNRPEPVADIVRLL